RCLGEQIVHLRVAVVHPIEASSVLMGVEEGLLIRVNALREADEEHVEVEVLGDSRYEVTELLELRLHIDTDRLPVFLHDGNVSLQRLVTTLRAEGEGELLAILRADTVRTFDPAGSIEHIARLLRIVVILRRNLVRRVRPREYRLRTDTDRAQAAADL